MNNLQEILGNIIALASSIAVKEYRIEVQLIEFDDVTQEEVQAEIDYETTLLNELRTEVGMLVNNKEVGL